MKEIKDVIAGVRDHGLFVHIAQCMAEQCKHVYYVGPDEKVMPRLEDWIVGNGFENITRVSSLWEVKHELDCVVFPDIGFAGEQKELVSQGIPVWGHHGADRLEWDKGLFLDTLKKLGMEVPPHTRIKGLTALMAHLVDKEDKYVKISRFRGDWETFHFRNWTMDEDSLFCHAYRLGPLKNKITFYVFDKIDATIEDGVDTWNVRGMWPQTALHAIERKDKSLIGGMQAFDDVEESIREVNELFGTVLAEYGYQGAFSTEIRKNDKTYFIDPTCRFGSPPSQLQTVLINNLATVIWAGANGECIEPEYDDPIGAQVLVTTDRDKEEYSTFQMPEELRPYIKSAFSCEVDNEIRIAPNPLENWAGWLVSTGPTIKSTIDTLKERKALLPDGFDCDISSFATLLTELEEAEKHGIEVTDQPIPDPSVALDA